MKWFKVKSFDSTFLFIENDFIVHNYVRISKAVPDDVIVFASIKCFHLNVLSSRPGEYSVSLLGLLNYKYNFRGVTPSPDFFDLAIILVLIIFHSKVEISKLVSLELLEKHAVLNGVS